MPESTNETRSDGGGGVKKLATVSVAPAKQSARSGTINVTGSATIEFVAPDAATTSCPTSSYVAAETRMGLWDNAWDEHDVFRAGGGSEPNFIDLDTRRFYVRVTAPGIRGSTLQARWLIRGSEDARILDDNNGVSEITLRRVDRSNVFVSQALMIVGTPVDLIDDVDPGAIPGRSPRSRGQADYRLRLASMFDDVWVGCLGQEMTAPVFLPANRKLLGLEILVMMWDGAEGQGEGPVAGRERILGLDLRVARQCLGRLGIWIWTAQRQDADAIDTVPPGQGHGPETLNQFDRPSDWRIQWPATLRLSYKSAEESLAARFPAHRDILRVFYVPTAQLTTDGGVVRAVTHPAGELARARDAHWNALDMPAQSVLGTIWVSSRGERHPYTLVHEIVHALLDADNRYVEGHYSDRVPNEAFNLMAADTSANESWDAKTRLWDLNRRDGNGQIEAFYNQVTTIMASRYVRNP